jgi:hypothetical protein
MDVREILRRLDALIGRIDRGEINDDDVMSILRALQLDIEIDLRRQGVQLVSC